MKLHRQDKNSFTFLIGKRERDLLVALLLRYPVLASSHFSANKPDKSAPHPDEALLVEALADQQKESRRALEEWLTTENRFKETSRGCSFTLTSSELEWLLQVLNDVRVGSWVQLGQPDSKTPPAGELNEERVELAWALEMAGLYQHLLLQAAQAGE